MLKESDIEVLVNGETNDQKDKWSMSELMMAGCIMATYHSLCGLVYGQGIKENIDISLCIDA